MNEVYEIRITRAKQYIEDNLNKRISLCEVAAASHFSEFHFHRIFTAIVGETVNNYIIRRRLERAVNMLAFKANMSITDIAMNSGFSSSANFSKAVKLYFGYSPSEIRNPKRITKIKGVKSKIGKGFDPVALYPHSIKNEAHQNTYLGDGIIEVEVKDFPSRRVCTLASLHGYEQKSVFETWDKVSSWAESNGIEVDEQQCFAFCFDNPIVTPIDKCRYEYAVVIDEDVQIDLPFKSSIIPRGKYAVMHLKGSPEEVQKSQLNIYSDWLASSRFEPDNFPLIEHYLNDLRDDGYLKLDVLIKLKILS